MNTSAALGIIICVFASGLALPSNNEYDSLFFIFLATIVIRQIPTIIRNRKDFNFQYTLWFVFFALIVVMTAFYRGSGLRVLGSELWGGFAYINILLSCAFIYSVIHLKIDNKHLHLYLSMMCLLSFIPLVSELINRGIVGDSDLKYFFQGLLNNINEDLIIVEEEERFRTFAQPAIFMCLLAFICNTDDNLSESRGLLFFIFIFFSFMIGSLSGHRIVIITIILIIFFQHWLKNQFDSKFLIKGVLIAVTTGFFFFLFSDYLPSEMRRSFSWLPWVKSEDASNSSEWRLLVWAIAWIELPNYWLIGKGLAFSYSNLEYAQMTDVANVEWAVITNNYHNGPLSVMIGFGVLGLFALIGLWVTLIKRYNYYIYSDWGEDIQRKQYFIIVYSYFLTLTITFIFIFGDVHISIPILFFVVALLEIIIAGKSKSFNLI